MERRLYFIIGDLSAAVLSGAGAGWLVQLIMPAGLSGFFGTIGAMIVGMCIGMVVGMAIGMLGGFLFTPFFGAMEPMLPAALSGMVAGMAVAMVSVMGSVAPLGATVIGAGAGVLCLVYTYVQQVRLSGEVPTQVNN